MEKSRKNQETKGKDHSASNSLYNCTLSPGWKQFEVEILKNSLIYFGVGRWKKILNSSCLPGKGDFMGLNVDIDRVFYDNMKKKNVTRKNNCDNPNKEERKRRIQENQEKYGLNKKQLQKYKKPKQLEMGKSYFLTLGEIQDKSDKTTTIETLERLRELREELVRRIKYCESKDSNVYQPQGNEAIYQGDESNHQEDDDQSSSLGSPKGNPKRKQRPFVKITDQRLKQEPRKKIKKARKSSASDYSSEVSIKEDEISLHTDNEEPDEQIQSDQIEEHESMLENHEIEEADQELYDYDGEEVKKATPENKTDKEEEEEEKIFEC